nr:beta-galactosidase [uncultured Desulfobacter sp.]
MNNITLNKITNKQLNSLLLFLCLILTCPGVCARADTKIEVTGISTGPDWSLPDGVHSSNRAGGLYMDQDPDYSFLCLKGITLSWANLNPAENQYDFSDLDTALEKAEHQNYKVIIRLKCHVTARQNLSGAMDANCPYVPQWVLDLHEPAQFVTRNTSDRYIRVAAPWDTGLQKELLSFIDVFGKKGYPADERIAGIYITGFSSSLGEEFWLHRDYLQNALNAGMTERSLLTTYQTRIDAWVDAAGEHVYKLIWIGYGEIQNSGYDGDRLNDYALDMGLGWRHGGPDTYHDILPPEEGQTYTNGYLNADWSHPLRDGQRIFLGEVEYTFKQPDADNAVPGQTHMTESAIMRMAQLGMNYAWTSGEFIAYAPRMFEWWTQTAGKNSWDSPDAACWLRQDAVYVKTHATVYPIKNFERFLYQRDQAGAKTVPVLPVNRAAFWNDPSGQHFDYSARSTDVRNDNDKMIFSLEPGFLKTLGLPFTIKITYFDNNASQWVLEVPAGESCLQSSPITGASDNTLKTVTFTINTIPDGTNIEENCAFRLRVLNDQDLTVKFARVIK